jgi:hypothetical protein
VQQVGFFLCECNIVARKMCNIKERRLSYFERYFSLSEANGKYDRQNKHCTCNVTGRAFVKPFLSGKNYSECVSVTLGIWHATCIHHNICGLSGCTVIFHIIS